MPKISFLNRSAGHVILIHGLWMNGMELGLLRWRLRAAGYRTRRFHYSSMRASVADTAHRLADSIAGIADKPLYVVAHSLGGLVTLRAFEAHPNLPVARVVFLGAPVRGSSVARSLNQRGYGPRLLGKGGRELIRIREPCWRFKPPLGVLAGMSSAGLGRMSSRIARPNDGTVAVAETAIDGATDSATVHAGHMGMVVSRETARQVTQFLQAGRFSPANPRPASLSPRREQEKE